MIKSFSYIDKRGYLSKIIKKHPLEMHHIVRTVLKTLRYRYLQKCLGKKSIVGEGTKIINFANVSIGNHCLIQDHVYIRAGLDGNVKINDYCAINSFAKLFGHGGIEIGEYTQLGPDCLITTTKHDYQKELKTSFEKVQIGRWAWVGAKCIILPGTKIGDHSIIGAGSIVNKDIPQWSVAVGCPARVIKTYGKKN
jgi:acetyltransferase-like isoleucine patch superfamily enzyme